MKKRVFSILMCLAMLLTLLSTAALDILLRSRAARLS